MNESERPVSIWALDGAMIQSRAIFNILEYGHIRRSSGVVSFLSFKEEG